MKKFINKKEDIVKEMLEGMAKLYSDKIYCDGRFVISKALDDCDRVTIVTYGGSGHEPAQSGFVGDGMIDIQVVGNIFTAPGPKDVLEAIKRADKGHGVLLLILNHAGDMLTGNMVMKMAGLAGLNVKCIITQEDVADAPRSEKENRRGLVGAVPMYHILGAAARSGMSLDDLCILGQRYADNMATIAVELYPGVNPITEERMGFVPENQMRIGVGQHGEAGGGINAFISSNDTIRNIAQMLIDDLGLQKGDNVFVMVNGSGATTLMELFILYNDCCKFFEEIGLNIVAHMVGSYLTTQEQAGFQLNIAKWDDEFLKYWSTSCSTPHFSK